MFTRLSALLRGARLLFILLAVQMLPLDALANLIDSIDIARVENRALITIRFTTEIQYLRHGPEDEGKFLRVFLRVSKPGFNESEIMQESLRSPNSPLVPRFTVIYPEVVNGMLITFAKSTRYLVRPGDDTRSILISVPLPEEQKAKAPAPVVEKPQPAAAPAAKEARPVPERKPAAPVQPPAAVEAPVPSPASSAIAQTPDADKAAAPVALAPERVEALAKAFIDEARMAFTLGDNTKAVNRLNRILGLPRNEQSEAAQALIGEVREKNGEIAKARAEYELYLKLYPGGNEAARLKQRLAGLPAADVVRRPVARVQRDEKPAEWQVNGSLSSYFFTGRSKFDSSPTRRDQESLVSSVSLNARLRDSVTDNRIVFRDTDSRNYLQSSRNYNRVYSAYAERTDREAGYFVRVGRQNPNGAGVLERFDGVTGSYNLGSDWRVNGVYGDAVEFTSPFNKKFYGTSVEFLPQLARPGASLYVIEQKLDGYLNRRAVGSELRYFDGQFTGYGMLDHDLLYKGLNIAAVQGNYLDQSGINYFVSYDYRNSPSYSLTNALGTTGYSTVGEMVSQVGLQQARTLVADTTAVSSMFAAGLTVPVGERWQFGADYRMSSISGTNVQLPLSQICKRLDFSLDPNDPLCIGGPRGDTPVSQLCETNSFDPANNTCRAGASSSGRTHMYSAQAIGTNLFVNNAVGVANVSWISGPNYSGQNYGLNYILPMGESWRLESNLRYYTQKSDDGQSSQQLSPSLKLAHQWQSSLFLETEIGYNDSKTSGTTQSQNRREYLYFGIRWDLR